MAPTPSSPFSRSVRKSTAFSMALSRLFCGKSGSTMRRALSSATKKAPQKPTWLAVLGQRFIWNGDTWKSSSMPTRRGFLALGFRAISTSSGTTVSRAQ